MVISNQLIDFIFYVVHSLVLNIRNGLEFHAKSFFSMRFSKINLTSITVNNVIAGFKAYIHRGIHNETYISTFRNEKKAHSWFFGPHEN